MSVANVLNLEEYRDRRLYRLRLAQALYGADGARARILPHLTEAAQLSGADRVATVWVDELGPGLVHPHIVLDLMSDRPRRSFTSEVLHQAWETGVPGVLDDGAANGPATFAIALGSDGTRAWFLVADSVLARPPLDQDVRDRLMFLAGECSAVLLHRDLDEEALSASGPRAPGRFVGWPILKDIEGREEDEAEGWRIAQRFVVARLVYMLLDEELVLSDERILEQAGRARRELARDQGLDAREHRLWLRILDCYEARDVDMMARTLVELAEMAEARDHCHGALALYGCAFDLAVAIGAPEPAVDAARLSGRLLRRRARWEEADRWYSTGRAIASAARLDDLAVKALCGLSAIKKELGNLPGAREGFQEALADAERVGAPDTVATVHAELLSLEHAAGNVDTALQHGWLAVATYESDIDRTRCLATLAGALGKYGDLEAAEDAWAVVAHTSSEKYYRIYAHDALAHLAATRGDAPGFDRHAALCDELDWENGPRSAKMEILYYRGLSCRALERFEHARVWLERAVTFAEEHSYNRALFEVEDALRTLATTVAARDLAAAPPEVRNGIRAMRQELVGV